VGIQQTHIGFLALLSKGGGEDLPPPSGATGSRCVAVLDRRPVLVEDRPSGLDQPGRPKQVEDDLFG
jgi:hypothetical protein